jgi:hypothetical protein
MLMMRFKEQYLTTTNACQKYEKIIGETKRKMGIKIK